jgi:hypothetical protein
VTIFTDFADVHWEAATAAGMHVACTYLQPGSGVPKTVHVLFERPDVELFGREARSREYSIHYRVKDLPDLKEGVVLSIEERPGESADYRVRADPFVDPTRGPDGTYKSALLTRIDATPI